MIYEFLTEKMKIITTSTKNDKLSTKNVKLITNCRVRIIFSEVIYEDLGRSSNSSRVWGSAVRIQIQKNRVQFNTFWSKL